MSKSRSSGRWLQEHFNDPYVKAAQKKGYRSRATFKLLELNERDKLLKPGMTVVDLGSAPGGWSQIAVGLVGKSGRVIGLDILPMEPLKDVEFIEADFTTDKAVEQLEALLDGKPVELVLSDMAPNMSGNKDVDQARVFYLADLALEFARQHLVAEGHFVVKVFQGGDFEAYLKTMRSLFKKVLIRKPEASRPRSPEVYMIGFNKLA